MAKNRVTVTDENFGELLIAGLTDAVAVHEGRAKAAHVTRRKLTTRSVEVAPPPKYRARKIWEVRRTLGVSQPVFACMLNVSPKTVRSWESGERKPEGATLRLLELAEKQPAALARAVRPRERKAERRPARTTVKKTGERTATKRARK